MNKYGFIFFIFLGIAKSLAQSFTDKIVFDQLINKDGLAHNNVLSLIQDKKGFIWIATQEGLDRYDGYSFKHFQHSHKDTSSLSKNQLRTILEDSQGYIWVGTSGGGLNRLDPQTEKFLKVKLDDRDLMGPEYARTTGTLAEDRFGYIWAGTTDGLYRINLSTMKVNKITLGRTPPPVINKVYMDTADNIWIGTFSHGLFKISLDKQGKIDSLSTKHWSNDVKKPNSLGSNTVMSILEDRTGTIWIAHINGLDQWNESEDTFTHFQHDPENPSSISSNYLNNYMVEDELGNLWISSTYGLNKFGPDRREFTSYLNAPGDPYSLSSNDVHSLLIDQTGTIWVGTINGGISRILSSQQPFDIYRHDPNNPLSLSSNVVKAIFEDKNRNVWVGTEGGGLNFLQKGDGVFQHFLHDPNDPTSLLSNNVSALLEDSKGKLWVGYGGGNYYRKAGGLSLLDRSTGEFYHIPIQSPLITGGEDKEVLTLTEDSDGFIWVGTQQGIKKIDPENLTIQHFHYQGAISNTISDNWCVSITEDHLGYLWVGTQSVALNRINRQTGEIKYYSHDPLDPNGLSSNSIRHIRLDGKGNLWLATNAGGLSHFDRKSEKFTNFTTEEGLPSNTVNRIEFDHEENLWLSTNAGICRFNPVTMEILTFDYNDGLQSNQFASGYFNLGASHAGQDGKLYFGGNEGFNAFYPDKIIVNKYIPPVVITQFRIFEEPVPGWEKGGEITLEYQQNHFSFEFAALNYINSPKNQYAYKLENFDKGWNFSGTRRYASYTNLNPGTYIFKVKGSNNDGIWNEEGVAIQLTILPPWWQTWLAYGLYLILVLGSLLMMKRVVIIRERLKGDLKLKKIEAEKLHELDRTKSDFFANISHEFRTPLTLISGTVEQLEEERRPSPVLQEGLGLIKRNADRLLQLVNQLLDLSKLEAGKLTLEMEPGDIIGFSKRLAGTFSSQFESKEIIFAKDLPEGPVYLKFDHDKLEKILSNLLINAFKFTPTGGQVNFCVSKIAEEDSGFKLEFKVKDNGIGIDPKRLPHIFERFYQGETSATRTYEGTGIGLALVKELTELHGGKITVESSGKLGTTFKMLLTLEVVDQEAVMELKKGERIPADALKTQETNHTILKSPKHAVFTNGSLPTVLIVEDNLDLRHFISQNLRELYNVVEAENGLEGFGLATEIMPDLIISDVMMPVMDGVSLADKVKNDERTSHIPFVLLTARADSESKISGLETGADAYLTKPFEMKELKVRIHHLIEGRKKLREKFSRSLSLQPSEIAMTSIDEKFLKKALTIMEENIMNTGFGVKIFSREIGMSRTNLHRKLKALTDCSATEFIRLFRLKRAKSLLEQKVGNVSEVAYAVGFNSLTYFAKCFKKFYGQTPSEFLSGIQKSKI